MRTGSRSAAEDVVLPLPLPPPEEQAAASNAMATAAVVRHSFDLRATGVITELSLGKTDRRPNGVRHMSAGRPGMATAARARPGGSSLRRPGEPAGKKSWSDLFPRAGGRLASAHRYVASPYGLL